MGIRHTAYEPEAEERPDSIYGNDWLGDIYQVVGGRQDTGGGWVPAISLGQSANQPIFIQQVDRLPPVVPTPSPPPSPPLPPSIVGGDETSLQGVVQVSWADYVAGGGVLPDDWNQYPHASDYPGLVGTSSVETGGGDGVGILGDIYDIVDESLGGLLPGGVAPFFQSPTPPAYLPPPGLMAAGGAIGAVPPQAVTYGGGAVPAMGACDPSTGMVYKKVCGQYKWVKQKRRRRRSLATNGDIQKLSALKGVLGNGKALQAWIATHS